MGQELRGDDGFGPCVARRLRELLGASETVLVLDAGPAPENFTGAIRRFNPDLVILVDAAEMDQIAGRLHLLDGYDCIGLSASTHTLPPSVLADYLSREVGCEVMLLGIQPHQMSIGSPMSEDIRASVERAASGLAETIASHELERMSAPWPDRTEVRPQ